MRDQPARLLVFQAAPKQLHCLRVREQIQRFQQSLKIPRVNENDGRFSMFLDDDRPLRVTHRLLGQLGRAIVKLCCGDSIHESRLSSSLNCSIFCQNNVILMELY